MYLIDTDVLSALRRGERHPRADRWLTAQRTSDLHLSVVTLGEIERGIEQPQRRDPTFARELAGWLDRVLAWYGDRVLPVDLATAQRWGRLSAALSHESAVLLIAATALEHGLTVVTRNVGHFEPAAVPVLRRAASLLPPGTAAQWRQQSVDQRFSTVHQWAQGPCTSGDSSCTR